MMFFRDYFGPALSVKIYNKWGSRAVEIAKQNPYRLAEEIDNIGFDKADLMAQKLGISKDSAERIEAGIAHVLRNEIMTSGHSCLPREKLIQLSSSILAIESDGVEQGIKELLRRQRLKCAVFEGEQYMYTAYSYECARYIAQKLIELDRL
jgi:exodeoxyribonuclease V alpha subunit